jgi:hypothetical protein
MLPFITHEMGHIVLDKEQDQSVLCKLKKIFYKDDELKDIIKENDSIIDEILSDIFALLLHGDAYVIAQAHELLGKNFVYQFYTQIEENPVNIIDFALKDDIKFTEALIRLLVIIDISNIFAIRENPKRSIEEIKDILEWLIPPLNAQNDDYTLNIIEMLEKNSNNLGNIYKQYNLIKTYRDFHYKITLLPNRIAYIINNKLDEILSLFNQIANEQTDIKLKNYKLKNYKDTYNELVESRFNNFDNDYEESKIESKNKIREIILKKDNVIEGSGNLGKPYELTYFKVRTDSFGDNKSYSEGISKSLKDEYKSMFFKILLFLMIEIFLKLPPSEIPFALSKYFNIPSSLLPSYKPGETT